MHHLLFIGAFLFFAFIAPLKTTVTFISIVLVVSCVVKYSAQTVGNVSVTLLEAFRAVAYAFALVALAVFTLFSFSLGTGISRFAEPASVVVLAGLFLAYALGFKLGLGTPLGASAGISVVSTFLSGLLLWLVSRAA